MKALTVKRKGQEIDIDVDPMDGGIDINMWDLDKAEHLNIWLAPSNVDKLEKLIQLSKNYRKKN